MTLELSLFTNCSKLPTPIDTIQRTHTSFLQFFGDVHTTIYVDKHPLVETLDDYVSQLKKTFPHAQLVFTNSLSDGYITSVKNSSADYLFQLEHDWLFQNITHSLADIVKVMQLHDIYHFRFSKHANKLVPELLKWQTMMIEKECDGFKYCETDNLSNNPHIIDRKKYVEFVQTRKIKLCEGSSGIEENLTKRGLVGCQYGGLDYPPTIKHLNGKK